MESSSDELECWLEEIDAKQFESLLEKDQPVRSISCFFITSLWVGFWLFLLVNFTVHYVGGVVFVAAVSLPPIIVSFIFLAIERGKSTGDAMMMHVFNLCEKQQFYRFLPTSWNERFSWHRRAGSEVEKVKGYLSETAHALNVINVYFRCENTEGFTFTKSYFRDVATRDEFLVRLENVMEACVIHALDVEAPELQEFAYRREDNVEEEYRKPSYIIVHKVKKEVERMYGEIEATMKRLCGDLDNEPEFIEMKRLRDMAMAEVTRLSKENARIEKSHKKWFDFSEPKIKELREKLKLAHERIEELQRYESDFHICCEERELLKKDLEEKKLHLQKLEDDLQYLRSGRLKDHSFREHADELLRKLEALSDLKGDDHAVTTGLCEALAEKYASLGLLPPNRAFTVKSEVRHLDQVEAVMDLYDEKIRRVEKDPKLSREDKAEKIEAWRRLREREIESLENKMS